MSTHEPKDTAKPAGGNGNGDLSRRDFLLKLGLGLNVLAGAMIAIPLVGYVMSSFVKKLPLKWTALGTSGQVPRSDDHACHLREPVPSRMGWGSRGNTLLGPARPWRRVSGLCHQLHSSWLSGALV